MRRWFCFCGMCLVLACSRSSHVVSAGSPPRFTALAADPEEKTKIAALAPRLDALLQERFSASGATGLAAGVVLDGELVYERHLGLLARGSTAAVSGETVFRVASLSKSFTALAVMQLRDQGRLSIDAPITEYLPELPALMQDAPPITARLLLTHSAGLPWDDTWGAVSFGFSEADLNDLLRAGITLAREPGSAFEYSNLGFALLGRLVARVSGVSFEDYLTQHLLLPLGMRSTFWRAGAVPAARLAVGYWGEGEQQAEAPRVGDGVFEPAGGMYTTLHDYARYLALQLSAYPARDAPEQGLVRRSTLRETHRAQRRVGPSERPIAERTADGVALHESSYGFGWFNETSCRDRERIEHGGWEPGYYAGVIMLPAQRVAVVTMATSAPIGAAERMLRLLHEAQALPKPSKPLASAALLAAQQAVISLVDHWDERTAQRAFDPKSVHYPWYANVRASFPQLSRTHGRCVPDGDLRASSRVSGAWKMSCERGALELKLDLTPAAESRIHLLHWTELLPPEERLAERAAQLAAAIGRGPEGVAELLAPSADRERLQRQLAHAAIDHGTCSIDRAIAGDGRTTATFALACAREPLELMLQLDDVSGAVASFDLHRAREPGAVCWQ